jgi:hypothetical protein
MLATLGTVLMIIGAWILVGVLVGPFIGHYLKRCRMDQRWLEREWLKAEREVRQSLYDQDEAWEAWERENGWSR